jgi:putative DNA primase/helicase
MNLKEFIESKGYEDFNPVLDGTFKEFKTTNHKGWYIGTENDGKINFTFGDWRSGDKFKMSTYGSVDRGEYEKQKKIIEEETLKKNLKTKELALTLYHEVTSVGPSPYLTKKKIEKFPSEAKTTLSSGGEADLIIPMYQYQNSKKEIWNLQKIQPDGFKTFLPGGKTKGLFFDFEETRGIHDSPYIFIVEGFATGCSLWEACISGAITSKIFCAFSKQNLSSVGETLKIHFPNSQIIFIADNDDTKPENYGVKGAREAASKIGAHCFIPTWSGDCNDLTQTKGLIALSDFIYTNLDSLFHSPEIANRDSQARDSEDKSENTCENLKSPEKESAQKVSKDLSNYPKFLHRYINGVLPFPEKYDAKGKLIPPHDAEIAAYIHNYFDDKIIKNSGDLFIYTGTHWKTLSPNEIHDIKLQIMVALGGQGNFSRVESIFKIFMLTVPSDKHEMLYKQKPHLINFLNGTLRLVDGRLVFGKHSKNEYLLNVIPYNYDTTGSSVNTEFLNMLDRIFETDPEKDMKILLLQEMYGSCLMQVTPHLFLLYGPGGRGKTSLIIPAMRLVHTDNWCSVEPHEFVGFGLESMAGKLVNFVTDINTNKPIEDSVTKKIQDRVPIKIDRKFKSAINAPIPAIHIFGANEIPPSYEKSSGAYKRRWSFIHCHTMDKSENQDYDFANRVFETSPEGVIIWAIEGLKRLVENGKFTTFKSDYEAVNTWETENDSIGLFLNDLLNGEVSSIRLGESGKIERKTLFRIYCDWYEESYNKKSTFGRNKFLSRFEAKSSEKFKLKIVDGIRFFSGLEYLGNDQY